MSTEPNDLHVLTGAYAVHALDDDERAAFEQHLRTCPACREEVRGLRAAAARLASSESVEVSPALRARVLAEVRQTRQLPPRLPEEDRRGRAWRRSPLAGSLSARPLATAAAAAAIVVAATLGGVAWQQHQEAEHARDAVQTVAEVLAAPDVRTVRGTSNGPGTATAAVSAQEDAAVFTARDLPDLPSGLAYQLWVLRDGRAVPEPVLRLGAGGTTVPVVADDVRDAQALAVTVEPSAGSVTPTSDPLLVVPLA